MIQITTLHHASKNGSTTVHSHKLTPNDTVTLFCIISGQKESIVSILEDHLLEAISGAEWNIKEAETDFSYVAEHFNHFIKNLSSDEIENISIGLAFIDGKNLSFSTIGYSQVILTEKDGEISLISPENLQRHEFHSLSSGEIPEGGCVYLSNNDIDTILGDEIILELSELDERSWVQTCDTILTREYSDNLHIFRIKNTATRKNGIERNYFENPILEKGPNILGNTAKFTRILLQKLQIPKFLKNLNIGNNVSIQYGFLIVGLILIFILIFSLIRAISGSIHTIATDSKNQLLEAQNLIEQSQKLINNPGAFNSSIKKAEFILFSLRDKKEHISDTQDLLGQIEAMKKEVNDIQTVDLSKYSSIVKFNPDDLSPVGIFEKNKKLSIIGRDSMIADYVRDFEGNKTSSYPPGESVIGYDVDDSGNFFLLTNNSRILSSRGSELTYVTVSGQDMWEKAKNIKTFNGNLYFVSLDGSQILKHKPGMNGFSPQTTVLPSGSASGIIDIGIDGGIYILTQEGKILQYISGKTDMPKSLIINKIPGEYTIGTENPARLFIRPNLSYLYILSGNHIWILQPDSKRFQDVSSLTYIAQLEIQTNEEMRNLYIPRDGTINIVTNLGIYEVGFEITDNKLILR